MKNYQATGARCLIPMQSVLGEGLHWDAAHAVLWGVDIHGCLVWRWNLQSELRTWGLDQRVGWVLPEKGSDRVLLGLQGGFALAHRDSPDAFEWLLQPFAGNGALRLNDAKADSRGTVWAGSLNNDDESRSDGCLFRLTGDGLVSVVDADYTVANGPAISPDGKTLLHTDSGRRTIFAFSLDTSGGLLGGKRVWKVFADNEGYPDGMTFDAEGCVWIAHWGASWISRFAPDGALLQRFALPVSQVTNVCFAGEALDRLFVTSARVGLDAAQLAREPEAGGVFEIVGHGCRGLAGLPAGPFAIPGSGSV